MPSVRGYNAPVLLSPLRPLHSRLSLHLGAGVPAPLISYFPIGPLHSRLPLRLGAGVPAPPVLLFSPFGPLHPRLPFTQMQEFQFPTPTVQFSR